MPAALAVATLVLTDHSMINKGEDMARPMNSIYDGSPRPGKFNTWGTKKEADAIDKVERELDRKRETHRKKARLYFDGKCKTCLHTDYKRSYFFGGENRVCDIWEIDQCPHRFGNEGESK